MYQPSENKTDQLNQLCDSILAAVKSRDFVALTTLRDRSPEQFKTALNRNTYEVTSLVYAVSSDDAEMTTWLIDNGASLDQPRGIFTMLHIAAENGAIQTLAVLKERDPEFFKRNNNISTMGNNTPLSLALTNNHEICVNWLLTNGADFSHDIIHYRRGYTLVHLSAEKGFKTTLMYLQKEEPIFFGKNINAPTQDNEGNSPIALAVRQQNYDVATWLIDQGANIEWRERTHLTRTLVSLALVTIDDSNQDEVLAFLELIKAKSPTFFAFALSSVGNDIAIAFDSLRDTTTTWLLENNFIPPANDALDFYENEFHSHSNNSNDPSKHRIIFTVIFESMLKCITHHRFHEMGRDYSPDLFKQLYPIASSYVFLRYSSHHRLPFSNLPLSVISKILFNLLVCSEFLEDFLEIYLSSLPSLTWLKFCSDVVGAHTPANSTLEDCETALRCYAQAQCHEIIYGEFANTLTDAIFNGLAEKNIVISNRSALRELIFSLLVQHDSLSLVMPDATRIPVAGKNTPFYICPQAAAALIDELSTADIHNPQSLVATGVKYLYSVKSLQQKKSSASTQVLEKKKRREVSETEKEDDSVTQENKRYRISFFNATARGLSTSTSTCTARRH